MKKSRYSEEQVIGILREGESGTPVKTVCAKHNISDATYYAWKRKYGGMDVSEARRLRSLEEENGRLKRLVADQAVQIQVLKEVNSKKRAPRYFQWVGRGLKGGTSSWSFPALR